MMVSRPSPCDRGRLEQLLEASLSDGDQAELSGHLERCEPCRKALEAMAATSQWWQDVRKLSLTEATDEEPGSYGSHDEPALGFLSPSEFPEHLGRLGAYEVTGVIGRGGMSVVFKALDPALNRVVAIKVLAPQLATSAAARRRFAREARAAAAVSHDHVVPIHAVDAANGLPYLVMPFLPGRSLQDRIDRDGPLEVKEILRIGMQAAAGLAAAHQQGLVHRDIKPANILLENGVERVKITDFGLARAIDDASTSQSGVIAGTPQYMAPEQACGEAIDHRADLFSLGSVMYAMAAGHSPFRAETTMAVLRRVSEAHPRPIREINPEIPEWLAAIIGKLHEKDPAERFQSASEVAEMLGRCLAFLQQPTLVSLPALPKKRSEGARRIPRWGVAAGLLILLISSLGAAEAAGVTKLSNLAATILRIRFKDWTLVMESTDDSAKLRVDGDEVAITDGGVEKIRVHPDPHWGEGSREVLTIDRGGKRTTTLRTEGHQPPETPKPRASVEKLREEIAKLEELQKAVRRMVGESGVPSPDGLQQASDDRHPQALEAVARQNIPIRRPTFEQPARGDQSAPAALKAEAERIARLEKDVNQLEKSINERAAADDEFEGGEALHHLVDELERLKSELMSLVMPSAPDTVQPPPPPPPPFRRKELEISAVPRGTPSAYHVPARGEQTLRTGEPSFGASVSPDGRTLAVGCMDGSVKLFNLQEKTLTATLSGHSTRVWSVAFAPDGKTLASCSGEWDDPADPGQVLLWEIPSGRKVTEFSHPSLVFEVAFSRDGNTLALAGWDQTVVIWNVAKHSRVFTLTGHTDVVRTVAFSPDGKVLASGSFDGTVKLWNPSNGTALATLSSRAMGVNDVAFSPDGKTLAAIGRSSDAETNPVMLWDVASRKERASFGGSALHALCLAFSPDGKLLATGGGEFDKTGELRLWNPVTGRERASFAVELPVEGIAFPPDGSTLIAAGWDAAVNLWSIRDLSKAEW